MISYLVGVTTGCSSKSRDGGLIGAVEVPPVFFVADILSHFSNCYSAVFNDTVQIPLHLLVPS